jgi:hypothetical protein
MNIIEDLLPYYGQPHLAALVDEVIKATNAIDLALERQEHAIQALAEGWSAVEAERMAIYDRENAVVSVPNDKVLAGC